jgi:putative mRNA 3-end processing factor
VLFAYALGKAQRLLRGLATLAPALPGPIYVHGAVARLNDAYGAAGVALPQAPRVAEAPAGTRFGQALVIAPPSARGSTWLRRFEPCSTAFASGWMALRGTRRRAALDRGFAFSDHADWPALGRAIEASGAREVWVTHGYRDELARWLAERGYDARAVETPFEGERGEAAEGERGDAAEGERGEAEGERAPSAEGARAGADSADPSEPAADAPDPPEGA